MGFSRLVPPEYINYNGPVQCSMFNGGHSNTLTPASLHAPNTWRVFTSRLCFIQRSQLRATIPPPVRDHTKKPRTVRLVLGHRFASSLERSVALSRRRLGQVHTYDRERSGGGAEVTQSEKIISKHAWPVESPMGRNFISTVRYSKRFHSCPVLKVEWQSQDSDSCSSLFQ